MRSRRKPHGDQTCARLWEVLRLAFTLGCTAFGGPAAHVALLRREVVSRRQWLTEQEFLDLWGATNLIPGPNSTEMVIYVGKVRAGWPGLVAGGVGFILPAATMVLGLAWLYVAFGTTVTAEWLLYGIKPVIIAVVAQALWAMSRAAVKDALLGVVGLAALVLYLAGANEIALLFGGGLLVALARSLRGLTGSFRAVLVTLPPAGVAAVATTASATAVPTSLPWLFFVFLKIGAVLYGSGYVLLAFLRNDFVHRLGWLTDRQLLDAIAVGQFTPGPVLTTATFIGYLIGGGPGAALATVGIFLPSFLFVAGVSPVIPHLRQAPRVAAVLDGVNAASLGLMAAVTWQLARSAVVDPFTGAVGAVAALLLIRFQLNSTWLVLGGGLAALVSHWIAG